MSLELSTVINAIRKPLSDAIEGQLKKLKTDVDKRIDQLETDVEQASGKTKAAFQLALDCLKEQRDELIADDYQTIGRAVVHILREYGITPENQKKSDSDSPGGQRLTRQQVADAKEKILAVVSTRWTKSSEVKDKSDLDSQRWTSAMAALKRDGEIESRGRGKAAECRKVATATAG